jgi:hypothetical protein
VPSEPPVARTARPTTIAATTTAAAMIAYSRVRGSPPPAVDVVAMNAGYQRLRTGKPAAGIGALRITFSEYLLLLSIRIRYTFTCAAAPADTKVMER